MKYDYIEELNRELYKERTSLIHQFRPLFPLMAIVMLAMSIVSLIVLVAAYAEEIESWITAHQVMTGMTLVVFSFVGIVRWGLNKW